MNCEPANLDSNRMVNLTVNGKPIPLNAFVQDFMYLSRANRTA